MNLWNLIHQPRPDQPYYSSFRLWLRMQASDPGATVVLLAMSHIAAAVIGYWLGRK